MPTEELPKSLIHDEAKLWIAYTSGGDQKARNELIHIYLPLAKRIATKLYRMRTHDDVDYEDYYQYAAVGLIEAIDRYKLNKGAAFETYATYRVKGAVLNGLKKLTEKREQSAYRHRVLTQRVGSLSDENPSTLFDELVDIAVGLAISYMLDGTGIVRENESNHSDTPYHKSVLCELRTKIKKAIWTVLSEKERTVILFHYGHELTFEVIAETISVTKGRVSQIHKNAIEKLRDEVSLDAKEFYA